MHRFQEFVDFALINVISVDRDFLERLNETLENSQDLPDNVENQLKSLTEGFGKYLYFY